MVYAYEAVFEYVPEDGCWYVRFSDFDGAFTNGASVAEAASNAADLLTLFVADALDEGEPLPEPTFHNPPLSVVCVDVTPDVIEETKLMTVKEAAEHLEVSPSRVSQLLNTGQLEAREYHGRRMVTIDSVNKRLASKPVAGRPRKDSVTA